MTTIKNVSRFSRFLRITLTFALTLGAVNLSSSSASAAPAAPVITSLSTQTSGATQQVTVNFNYGDASTVTGFKYSTDGGSTFDECDSSKCNWTAGNAYVVIQKISGGTSSMSNGTQVNIVLRACGTGSGNTAGTGLSNCSGNSRVIAYTVGVTSTPTISTSSTVANGATNPSITITSTNFETTTALSLFTVAVGTTGLTANAATWNSATSVTIDFTGTAAAGTITIQASLSAFAPTTTTASNTVSVTVAATTPGAPTSVDSSTVTGTDIRLTWVAPTNNGGASITDYTVQYKVGVGGSWTTFTSPASTNLYRLVTGLSPSTTYYFQVAARNSVGLGTYSSAFGPVTTGAAPTVPETPTAVSAGSATSSSLSVSWTAPTNNGGSSILDYTIQKSTDGTTWTSAATGASSPHTVTGLSASTSYVFRVAARNSVGLGPYSDSSTALSTSAASSPPAPEPERIYPPMITSLSKLKVCARGHDEFMIRGGNFKDATVTVDGVVVTVKGKSDGVINLSFGETTEGIKKITVTNSAGSATAEVEFKMVDKTAFKVFDIPYIYKGGSFLYQFEAFGENTFRVTGNMPAGLVLNAETGEISGIPTEEGKFNFVLHADGLCGNDVDVIKLDVDKEIPNAISYRIKFTNKKSKKIAGTAQFELNKFLKMVKEISPKQIEPIIYITGGAPDNESDLDSQSAKERRDSLCDIMLTNEIIGQTMLGLFDGEEDEIEIFVYWPVVR